MEVTCGYQEHVDLRSFVVLPILPVFCSSPLFLVSKNPPPKKCRHLHKKWGSPPQQKKHAPCIFLIKRTSHQLEVEETENNVEDVQPAEVHPEKDEVSKPAVEMPEQQGGATSVDLLT